MTRKSSGSWLINWSKCHIFAMLIHSVAIVPFLELFLVSSRSRKQSTQSSSDFEVGEVDCKRSARIWRSMRTIKQGSSFPRRTRPDFIDAGVCSNLFGWSLMKLHVPQL